MMSVSTYTYVGVTKAGGPHNCWITNNGRALSGTEVEDADYILLSLSDDLRYDNTDGPGNNNFTTHFEFEIAEHYSTISQMVLTHEGYVELATADPQEIRIWAYNRTTASWELLSTTGSATSDITATGTLSASFNDYISSNRILFAVSGGDTHTDNLYTDFVKLDVTYATRRRIISIT